MKNTKNSLLSIGSYNSVFNIVIVCPAVKADKQQDFDEITESGDNIYNITPNMINQCSFQNDITNKFTYCKLVLNIPMNDNATFDYIYSCNYTYVNISLTMTSNQDILSKTELETIVNDNLTYNYVESFLVNSKQLLGTTANYKIYEFSLISTRWWNFHKNIHYSTKGKKESISTIIQNVYGLANQKFSIPEKWQNLGYLDNTFIEYSTSANDNLLTIEKYLKHKVFNLNYFKNIDFDAIGQFNCIIVYNKLTGKYFPWFKPSLEAIQDLINTSNLPNNQTDIPVLTVSVNNTSLTSDSQAVLSNKKFTLINKTDQYLNQRQIAYQTYNYDSDNIEYNIISQQNKHKFYINDNDINESDLANNVMYPYSYLITENKQTNKFITVIPNQQQTNYTKYVSISEDSSNAVHDIEQINFNVNTIVIFTNPQIKYNVGHIIFLKFVNSFAKNDTTFTAYALYSGYYIIKSTNLVLQYNNSDVLTIVLSKLY